jgi:hypothetical protein
MKPDPPIDEIRKVRHQISASVDHDPRKLVEHYRQLQERLGDRIVTRTGPESQPKDENAA